MKKALILLLFLPVWLRAETGHEAWLRYEPLRQAAKAQYSSLPASVVVLGDSVVLASAREEIIRGMRGMLGRTLRSEKAFPRESAIVLGTFAALRQQVPSLAVPKLPQDGFWLTSAAIRGLPCLGYHLSE
jgi:alpha-glucuronidase